MNMQARRAKAQATILQLQNQQKRDAEDADLLELEAEANVLQLQMQVQKTLQQTAATILSGPDPRGGASGIRIPKKMKTGEQLFDAVARDKHHHTLLNSANATIEKGKGPADNGEPGPIAMTSWFRSIIQPAHNAQQAPGAIQLAHCATAFWLQEKFLPEHNAYECLLPEIRKLCTL